MNMGSFLKSTCDAARPLRPLIVFDFGTDLSFLPRNRHNKHMRKHTEKMAATPPMAAYIPPGSSSNLCAAPHSFSDSSMPDGQFERPAKENGRWMGIVSSTPEIDSTLNVSESVCVCVCVSFSPVAFYLGMVCVYARQRARTITCGTPHTPQIYTLRNRMKMG